MSRVSSAMASTSARTLFSCSNRSRSSQLCQSQSQARLCKMAVEQRCTHSQVPATESIYRRQKVSQRPVITNRTLSCWQRQSFCTSASHLAQSSAATKEPEQDMAMDNDADIDIDRPDLRKYLELGGRAPRRRSPTLQLFTRRSQRSEQEEQVFLDSNRNWGKPGAQRIGPIIHQRADEAMKEFKHESVRNDKFLNKLLRDIQEQARSQSTLRVIGTCKAFRARLNQLAKELQDDDIRKPPMLVYRALLQTLSSNGRIDACQNVLDDMRAVGHEQDIMILDLLLHAAVTHNDTDKICSVLLQIADLPVDLEQQQQQNDDFDSNPVDSLDSSYSSDGSLLSPRLTRNWSAVTYQHLFKLCRATHNVEFALILLGSASRRSVALAKANERPGKSTARNTYGDSERSRPFIRSVLNHATVQRILILMAECRQARLAADLAYWFDSGVAARRIDVHTWMTVLRCCAEERFFAGTALAWKFAVVNGRMLPDEGLFLSVLHAASRSARASFITNALETYKQLAPPGFELRSWHVMPLMDAHVLSYNFEGAIRTAMYIERFTSGAQVEDMARNMRLFNVSVSFDKKRLRKAMMAFLKVGRDMREQDGGSTTVLMNALIQCATKARMPEVALKLYASRHYLRNAHTDTSLELPALPSQLEKVQWDTRDMHLEPEQEDVVQKEEGSVTGDDWSDEDSIPEQPMEGRYAHFKHVLADLMALEQQQAIERKADSTATSSSSASSAIGIKADISTYNELLLTAIAVQSRDMCKFIIGQINRERLHANELTYERAIRLIARQDTYEEAFTLLEECKLRGYQPTRRTYEALGLRCFYANDERWVGIGRELIDLQIHPGHTLMEALRDGGWIDSGKLSPFLGHETKASSRPKVWSKRGV